MWGRVTLINIIAAAFSASAMPTNNLASHFPVHRSERQLSVGDILVASEKLGDPNFARSVVLLVQYDEDKGTVGLVINRRTEIPLSRIFPKTKHAPSDPVYMGGPVSITAVQALLRLSKQTDQATPVVADIYVTGAKELIEKSVASRAGPSKFRLYLGYAGWAPGQLETEIELGAWAVLHSDPDTVFDENPESLWSRLRRESHMQIARLPLLRKGLTVYTGIYGNCAARASSARNCPDRSPRRGQLALYPRHDGTCRVVYRRTGLGRGCGWLHCARGRISFVRPFAA
jgi:putative transcriptional regulator